jgi:hypothetical protein
MVMKKIETVRRRTTGSNRGSALPTVMAFAIIAVVSVTTYHTTQQMFITRSMRMPAILQAQLTARSGVWAGMTLVNGLARKNGADNPALFTGLGRDMFLDLPDTGFSLTPIPLSESPQLVKPFSNQTFGNCSLSLCNDVCFKKMRSIGFYRNQRRSVEVVFGCRPFTSADTVVYMMGDTGRLQARAISGAICRLDTGAMINPALPFGFDRKKIDSIFFAFSDTLDLRPRLLGGDDKFLVTSDNDLRDFPAAVNRTLFIDGSRRMITWREKKTITVGEDLQITGGALLKGLTFIVAGDIKLMGAITLDSVNLYCGGKLFFGDEQLVCSVRYNGQAMACKAMEICRNTEIEKKSLLILGNIADPSPKSGPKRKSTTNPTQNDFGIYIRDNAAVNGTVICMDSTQGIKIFPNGRVEGIVWSESSVCHKGAIKGVLVARTFTGGEMGEAPSTIDGMVAPNEEIAEFLLPAGMGPLSILEWRE